MAPRSQVAGERGRGLLDVGEVRVALLERGGHVDDGDVEAGHVGGVVRRQVATGGQGSGQARVGDVLDVGVPVGQPLDPVDVEVEADDVVADLDGPQGEGQADVALADDDQLADGLALGAHRRRVRRGAHARTWHRSSTAVARYAATTSR